MTNIVAFNPSAIPVVAVFGFGIDDTTTATVHLRMKFFASVLETQCRLEHNPAVYRDDNFCATVGGSPGHLAGGDQGGPVTNALRNTLLGIVSYFPVEWEAEQPTSVFVELNYHSEFIANHTETGFSPF